MSKMQWSPEADRKLLVNILGTCSPKLDYTALAKIMSTDGHECNEKAIINRLTRLRKEVNSAEKPKDSGEESSGATPTGQKRKGAKEKTSAPAKKRGKKQNEDSDEVSVKVEKQPSESPSADEVQGEDDLHYKEF